MLIYGVLISLFSLNSTWAQTEESSTTSKETKKHFNGRVGVSANRIRETRTTSTFAGDTELKFEFGKSTAHGKANLKDTYLEQQKEGESNQELSYEYDLWSKRIALQVAYFGHQSYLRKQNDDGSVESLSQSSDTYGIGPNFTLVDQPRFKLTFYIGPAKHVQVISQRKPNESSQVTEDKDTVFTRTTFELSKLFNFIDYKFSLRFEPAMNRIADHDIYSNHEVRIPLGAGWGISYNNTAIKRSMPLVNQPPSRQTEDIKIEYEFKADL